MSRKLPGSERSPQPDVPFGDSPLPIVAIGGLLTIKQLAGWYEKVLSLDTESELPPSERFIAPHKRGLSTVEALREDLDARLSRLHSRLGTRLNLVGHSLGGLMAVMAALEKPELIANVFSLGGVHDGFIENPANWTLRYLVGNPKEAELLKHNSDFMEEHRERLANEWPIGTSLHIISTPLDILITPPHGFDVNLDGRAEVKKQLIISPLPGAEWLVRRLWSIPDDVEMMKSWYPTEHLNLPRNPEVSTYIAGHTGRLAVSEMAAHSLDYGTSELQLAAA